MGLPTYGSFSEKTWTLEWPISWKLTVPLNTVYHKTSYWTKNWLYTIESYWIIQKTSIGAHLKRLFIGFQAYFVEKKSLIRRIATSKRMSKRLISNTFRFDLLIMINFKKYGWNMAKTWSIYGKNMGNIWRKHGEYMAETWEKHGCWSPYMAHIWLPCFFWISDMDMGVARHVMAHIWRSM